MNIFKRLYKTGGMVILSVVYAIFTVIILLTQPPNGVKLDVFLYTSNISFLLGPGYLLYIGSHNRITTNLYCTIRLKSRFLAYLERIKYLSVETVIFFLPFALFFFCIQYYLWLSSTHIFVRHCLFTVYSRLLSNRTDRVVHPFIARRLLGCAYDDNRPCI